MPLFLKQPLLHYVGTLRNEDYIYLPHPDLKTRDIGRLLTYTISYFPWPNKDLFNRDARICISALTQQEKL